jgi:hypothetical protein
MTAKGMKEGVEELRRPRGECTGIPGPDDKLLEGASCRASRRLPRQQDRIRGVAAAQVDTAGKQDNRRRACLGSAQIPPHGASGRVRSHQVRPRRSAAIE